MNNLSFSGGLKFHTLLVSYLLFVLLYVSFGNILLDGLLSGGVRVGILISIFSIVIIVLMQHGYSSILDRVNLFDFIILLLVMFWAFWSIIPFREFNSYSQFFILIAVFFIFLVKSEIRVFSVVIFTKFLFLTALLTVVTAIFLALTNGNLPYIDVYHGRPYRLYITGSAALVSNHFSLPFSGARLSSFFAEPGHAAVVYLVTWWASRGYVTNRIRMFLLLGGLLTFSSAFYAGLLLILMVRFYKVSIPFIFIILISSSFFVFSDKVSSFEHVEKDSIEYRLFVRHLGALDDDNPLDHRTKIDWNSVFSGMNYLDLSVGLGGGASQALDLNTSDVRGFIFKFGWVGICLFFLLSILLVFNSVLKNKRCKGIYIHVCMGIVIFMFTMLHRHWMVDNFSFLFLILFGASVAVSCKYHRTKEGYY